MTGLITSAGVVALQLAVEANLITEVGRETAFTGGADPYPFAITVPAGTDFIVVKCGWESSRTITDVKIGATGNGAAGTSLTKDATSAKVQDVVHSEIWYGNWSTTGVQECWIDMSASGAMAVEVVYLADVHQSNPIVDSDGGVTNGGEVCTLASALVPGAETCWCEAVLGDGEGATVTHAWSGGVTLENTVDHGAANLSSASAADVTTNITPSVERSGASSQDMAMSAILLRPAA